MTSTEAATPAKKSNGQWALGEPEPLNPNEVFKQEDDGLNLVSGV